ncbi:MAG: ABC transporter substrate-binding protein [Actinobacteria bacterium]|nr:ABC transporter substrate-binding protein [Actinomycetota bacterium]
MKRLIAFLLMALTAVALAACGSGSGGSSSGSDSGPVVLGFAIGETGFMQPFDGPAKKAAEFAIEDINKKGGAAGRKFETVSADTKSKPELSGDAATQVLSDGAEIVIPSGDFDQGSPAAIVAQEKGVLAFSPSAASTAWGPTGIGPLAFTMATAAGAEGATMAEWAFEKKGWKTAYLLTDDTLEFTKQSAFGFKERWKELGGNLVGEDTFKQEDQSIASQINAIKGLSEQPEAIYLTSYMPGQAAAIKQIRAAGLNMPILAEEDVDGDYWKEAVPGVSGIYYATYVSIYGDDPSPEVNELVARYEKAEGKRPESSLFVTGYATIQAIAKAIEITKGSTDGTELQKALEGFENEELLLPTTFTDKYHITLKRTLRVMQIENGKTSFVEKWTPKVTPVPTEG